MLLIAQSNALLSLSLSLSRRAASTCTLRRSPTDVLYFRNGSRILAYACSIERDSHERHMQPRYPSPSIFTSLWKSMELRKKATDEAEGG